MAKVSKALLLCAIAVLVASAQVDPTLLNLVPQGAKFIDGIRIDSARSSPFGQYVLSQIGTSDPGFQQFVQTTGFDPTRDVSEILAATAGTSSQPSLLVLARGTFDTAQIAKAATSKGAVVSDYKGIQLLTHPEANGRTGALAFLMQGTIAVLGSVGNVQGAIDRTSQTTPTVSADVMTQIGKLSAANDAWFLSTGPITDFLAGKVADPNLGGALQGNLLQAIQQASGGVKFGDKTVVVSAQAVARSDKDAESLRDVVKFLAGLVQLNKDKDPNAQKVATLLDTLQVNASGNTMTMSVSIPEAAMEQLFVPPASRPHVHRAARLAAAAH